MQTLWLTDAQARTIAQHSLDDAPHEACGIIGGRDGQALQIIPVPNIADDPYDHYRLDDAVLANTLMRLRREGLSIIGFYHSHPDGDPIPSQTDIQQATYPDTAYLIVGLKHGEPRLAAWVIHYGNVQRLPLHIGFDAPDESSTEPFLSGAQKTAIIISAVLAFTVMLLLSLSLLPPAPEIPVLPAR